MRSPLNVIAGPLIAVGGILLALLGWHLTARGMPEFVLPTPARTLQVLLELSVDKDFLSNAAMSALRLAISIVLAILIGGGIALAGRYVPLSGHAVHRVLMPVLSSFPSVGWAILATVWFAPGILPVVFIQVMILVPFCVVLIDQGLRQMDTDLLELGRSFTHSRRKVAMRIALPMLMPSIGAALRISYGVGWKIATIAELFGAESGLGFVMQRGQVSSNSALVFATALAIVVVFMLGEKLIINPIAGRFGPAAPANPRRARA